MSNFALNFNMFCDMIDQIIDYNKDFVARKGFVWSEQQKQFRPIGYDE